ncbi:hypothetical protein KR009_002899 [Drosophila setifemur]|nr:hypothetical protein KR009_002899 [Drosophila setifemur]
MNFYLEHVVTHQRIYLHPGDTIFGRHPLCTWVFENEFVSQYHAMITRFQNQLFIQELLARNGVFVNGQRVGTSILELMEGDDVCFGVDVDGSLEQELPVSFGIFTVQVEYPNPLQSL